MMRLGTLALLGLLFVAAATRAEQTSPLGRLFFSPAQRAALDALRDAPQPIVPEVKPSPPSAPKTQQAADTVAVSKPPSEDKVRREPRRNPVLTGFVERSSGTNTVWIDRQAKQINGGYGELDPLDVGKARQ